MPQASDELRAEMRRRFGDPLSGSGPIEYLLSKGWTLNNDWSWSKPDMLAGNVPDEEDDCIKFLVDEWDCNGIREWREMVGGK